MQRCWLQGATDDALRALCCPVAYNIRWLLKKRRLLFTQYGTGDAGLLLARVGSESQRLNTDLFSVDSAIAIRKMVGMAQYVSYAFH